MTAQLIVVRRVRSAEGPVGDAVLVRGGRIEAIGEAADMASGDVATISYPDATLVPGLRDAHLHPVGHAASLHRPSLYGADDLASVADIVAAAVRRAPPGTAITAMRLDDQSLAEGRLPDRDFLDPIVGDHPTLLVRYCGHIAVASTAALAMAGIGATTADPVGGSIDRNDRGRPTGVLRETAADMVARAIQRLTPQVTPDQIVDAAIGLASVGLTGIGAIVGIDAGCWAGADSELGALLDAGPDMPITVRALVAADDPNDLEEAARRLGDAGPRVSFLGVKIFSDGSLGGHTAAMHEQYADRATKGTHRLNVDRTLALAHRSVGLGGMVAIHAIGDAANTRTLDIMGQLIEEGVDPAALRIEHASVLTAADIDRFGSLGITASIQPAFIASETKWLEDRVGTDRLSRTYAFAALGRAGVPLAGGSDSPVEPPHPLAGMAVARDRCGIVPQESLDAAQALQLFTEGSAAAIGESAALMAGAPASFTVLDVDPAVASPDDIRRAEVLATWVEGRRVPIHADVTAWLG